MWGGGDFLFNREKARMDAKFERQGEEEPRNTRMFCVRRMRGGGGDPWVPMPLWLYRSGLPLPQGSNLRVRATSLLLAQGAT